MLLNLVGNAIRHGQPGGQVSVEVAADPASSMLTVTVTDDGPGIPPDLLPRLFTPFALADTGSPDAGSAAPDGGGEESIGLGLALAHGLAGAMGGELSVGSSSAAGTTMRLRLAQVPGPAAQPDPPPGGRP